MNHQIIEQFKGEGVQFNECPEIVSHLGRSREVKLLTVVNSRGRQSKQEELASQIVIPAYNEEIIEAAKRQIEAEIEAEKERERAEAENREKARLEAEKQAEAEKERLLEEIERLKNEPVSRYHKATKYIAATGMGGLFILLVVTFAMNGHNLSVLYEGIIHKAYLYGFAFVLAFTLVIFAWAGDANKVKMALWILPVDFFVSVLLFIFLSDQSPLVQSWGWLKVTRHFWHLGFTVTGVAFYAFQVRLIAKLLLQSIEKKDDLFMSLFK